MRHNFGKSRIYYIFMVESNKIEILSNVFRDTILTNDTRFLAGIYSQSSSNVKIENNLISNLKGLDEAKDIRGIYFSGISSNVRIV